MSFATVYHSLETLFYYEVNFLIPVFYLPFLIWFAYRAHGSRDIGSSVVAKKPLIIHSVLNVLATLVWILIYGEIYINPDSPWFAIFDVAAPIGMLLLLIVLPSGLITAWCIGPKGKNSAVKKPTYILASKIYYVVSVIPSFWMILFFIGMASGK